MVHKMWTNTSLHEAKVVESFSEKFKEDIVHFAIHCYLLNVMSSDVTTYLIVMQTVQSFRLLLSELNYIAVSFVCEKALYL